MTQKTNPIFEAMGGGLPQGMPNFVQFMQQMRGQNPSQIINGMLQNGQLSQQQLNEVQGKAQGIMQNFDQFKGMFGFR